jgi:CTP synthase
MQLATIEYARNVLKMAEADSTEFNEKTKYPVFNMMEDKKEKVLGGTLRLGYYDAKLLKGSLVHKIYGKDIIKERHRHRYEFNDKYIKDFGDQFVFSGVNPITELIEFIELKDHPFFVGTQAHPEFTSHAGKTNPLFRHFIKMANN